MNTYNGILLIIGVLAVVLFIGAKGGKAEWLVNFILRGVLGMMMIYFVNYFLAVRGFPMGIGYNLVNFLTSGILGFPGVLLLYGINIYMIL